MQLASTLYVCWWPNSSSPLFILSLQRDPYACQRVKCRTAGSGPRAENQRMGPNLIQRGDPARGFLCRVCLKNNMEGKSFCVLPLFLLSVLPIKPSIPHFPSASDKEGGEERERERNHWLGRDYIQAPKDCTRRAAQRWVSPSPPLPVLSVGPRPNKMGGNWGRGEGGREKAIFQTGDRRRWLSGLTFLCSENGSMGWPAAG